MKRKLLSFICILLVFIISVSACNTLEEKPSDTTPETPKEDTETSSQPPQTDQVIEVEKCTSLNNHDYVEVSRIEPLALKEGEIKYQCSRCKNECFKKIPATKSLKILAIGNSFTQDSTTYLWGICNDAGIKDLVVANLYTGNCTLDRHWNNIYNDDVYEQYQKYTAEEAVVSKNTQLYLFAITVGDFVLSNILRKMKNIQASAMADIRICYLNLLMNF